MMFNKIKKRKMISTFKHKLYYAKLINKRKINGNI